MKKTAAAVLTIIKIHYKGMSDEDLTKEIAMNPYLQYFLGLQEYRNVAPWYHTES